MGSLCDRENLKLYLSVQALIKLFERFFTLAAACGADPGK
jgi:hypothetical protein